MDIKIYNLDQNTQRKGILESAEETYWEWSGKSITLGELTATQLKIVKKSIKNYSKRELWFEKRDKNGVITYPGVRSGDVLTNIDIIFDYRKKDPMYDIYNQASERFIKRSYKKADLICKILMPHIEKSFSLDLRDTRKVNS